MRRNKPGFSLSQLGIHLDGPSGNIRQTESPQSSQAPSQAAAPFAIFADYVDPTGNLSFEGKAVINANGVDFSSGKSYKISMTQMEVLGVLGRGQYGVVHKVFHKPTKVTMALKEIRLELNQRALQQIIMELDVLHKARSPYIVDFYGAFFSESCVYYSMEYMDFGSLDRLYPAGIPEAVLAKITFAVVRGLQFLKDELNIIHRDVKPTNILVNKKGEVKLCDFGVSGELNKSLAKTHVGCQSYMAPERIVGPGSGPSGYTIQSDVWSLGLTIIEVAIGRFPYDNSGFANVFDQLNAIVHGDAPTLPADRYSDMACDFVAQCLNKDSKTRPTYQQLLDHEWMKHAESDDVDMQDWAERAHALFLARTSKSS
ncbi:MAP kinase kinase Wis1 [Coemansia spiralis]|uniref:mitogen-activated protein kinase kinase n=2 Tax=Coemansia TaxID=4863 RepID=A0A9W8FXN8_9FUNG|nr:kinase-like domain-containing protein [Coemansia spiralis]KAJ1987177.1 MAP kinase kinase Wis1 [Coemansia umbellata]KAJ2619070.1 MAP kinase kinase Wis1 [Coemansia sp. RSA 1358]KAJ2669912.1 MAP kinase kinase Wis1 [Coemansia spiralis]